MFEKGKYSPQASERPPERRPQPQESDFWEGRDDRRTEQQPSSTSQPEGDHTGDEGKDEAKKENE